jgi:hypothetical protein
LITLGAIKMISFIIKHLVVTSGSMLSSEMNHENW